MLAARRVVLAGICLVEPSGCAQLCHSKFAFSTTGICGNRVGNSLCVYGRGFTGRLTMYCRRLSQGRISPLLNRQAIERKVHFFFNKSGSRPARWRPNGFDASGYIARHEPRAPD